jgi:hypothetical protein
VAMARWSGVVPSEPSANAYLIARLRGDLLFCRGCFQDKPGFEYNASSPSSSAPTVPPQDVFELVVWYMVVGDAGGTFAWSHLGLTLLVGPADWDARTWGLLCPDWMLLILLGLAPGIWLLRYRSRRARRRQRLGLCRACGYDLRASPLGCPECGAAMAS